MNIYENDKILTQFPITMDLLKLTDKFNYKNSWLIPIITSKIDKNDLHTVLELAKKNGMNVSDTDSDNVVDIKIERSNNYNCDLSFSIECNAFNNKRNENNYYYKRRNNDIMPIKAQMSPIEIINLLEYNKEIRLNWFSVTENSQNKVKKPIDKKR
jgi:N-acetylmuramoyl-L-alanine amidase